MKKSMFLVYFIFLTFVYHGYGQDLLSHQIPETILDQFQNEYAKAHDVEWEKKGDLYKVDFELKRGIDFEVWYDADGTIVRQEEELKKSKLPAAVEKSLGAEFPDYRIEDIVKIIEGDNVQFKVDLESRTQSDLEVWFDSDGKVHNSLRD